MIFVCPKCMGKLNITDSGAAVCERGHSYDRSRFGYYNLLLAERGGVHGDNKEMVLARREFLSRGHYGPLAERIAEVCHARVTGDSVILDAGCGEGYYTERIRRRVTDIGTRVAVFDISKDAVREAAKKRCADEYAVASSYRMPVADESVDLVVNTFSPQAREETARVLKRGGYFVMAIPAEEHLFGLKAAVYDAPYKNEVMDTELEGFEPVAREELKYTLKLNTGEDIRSLFMMTPYAYRTRREGRERALALTSLETEIHFLILIYRKA